MLDIDLTQTTLSPSQQTLLYNYCDLFASDDPLGHTAVVRHAIYTEGPRIHRFIRRQPVALQNTFDSEVQKMLQQGVI